MIRIYHIYSNREEDSLKFGEVRADALAASAPRGERWGGMRPLRALADDTAHRSRLR